MYRQTPMKVGAGIGLFGAVFLLVTTTLLFIVPQELLSPAASSTYIETWSGPIMTVGGVIFSVVIPLACIGSGYYLMRHDYSPQSAVSGFLIGGLVFILVNAIFGVFVSNIFVYGSGVEQSLLGHIQNSIPHGLRIAGSGLLGVGGAHIVAKYL